MKTSDLKKKRLNEQQSIDIASSFLATLRLDVDS